MYDPWMDVTFWLPWPPTVNNYYRRSRHGGLFLDPKVEAFRVDCSVLVPSLDWIHPVRLALWLHPPDQRKRDIDNILKGTQDALQQCGLFRDDSQIKKLHINFREPRKPGAVRVVARQMRL